jgi:CDP-diacylglycerol--glycerol-3-phosphate 3-phosphatidyltransferase
MAVVVMGREMLVTAIRSEIEGRGGDFSAKMMGKLKMVFQCVAAVASLFALQYWHQVLLPSGLKPGSTEFVPSWLSWTQYVSVWLALISTVWSGVEYIFAAARILSRTDEK